MIKKQKKKKSLYFCFFFFCKNGEYFRLDLRILTSDTIDNFDASTNQFDHDKETTLLTLALGWINSAINVKSSA